MHSCLICAPSNGHVGDGFVQSVHNCRPDRFADRYGGVLTAVDRCNASFGRMC